jgi:hypothetical protein
MELRESIPSNEPLGHRRPRLRLWPRISLKRQAARIFARMAGLPIALRRHQARLHKPAAVVRLAYARRFWSFNRPAELAEFVVGVLLMPAALLGLSIWFLWRNGAIVASQFQRPLHAQFADHLRLYFGAGVLPPWYYIYELYKRPTERHARDFIYRWESKNGVIALLKERRPPASIVSDKIAFATHCDKAGIATVPVLGFARGGKIRWLSEEVWTSDWFVKPVDGKGGKGIERWVRISADRLCGPDGQPVPQAEVVRRLAERSLATPCIIQPRVTNHAALSDLNNGALATVRALTCLDEAGEPELVGAVLRMAIGGNHVVDNLHAGGIAAGIDLQTGLVGPATNLGSDVRLGWLDRHPMSGAMISGRRLPYGKRIKPFAEAAHRAFADRVLIGWDIAITPGGLMLVEANGAPDFDIMQRPVRRGMMRDRLGELLAYHLRNEVAAAA